MPKYAPFTVSDAKCTPDEKYSQQPRHTSDEGGDGESTTEADKTSNHSDEPIRHWGDDVVLKLTDTGSVVSQERGSNLKVYQHCSKYIDIRCRIVSIEVTIHIQVYMGVRVSVGTRFFVYCFVSILGTGKEKE